MTSPIDEIAQLSRNYNFTLDIDTLLNSSTTTRRAKFYNRRNARPPRPQNAFILYRRDMAARTDLRSLRSLKSSEISKTIGNMWKNEPTEVKEVFYALARLAERRHSEMYREYNYNRS